MSWAFDNSYARLPERFYARIAPEPAPAPELIAINGPLAAELGIAPGDITAAIATGTELPAGAEPIAQAYAGHQFGQFVPQLGDGRAHLLGEIAQNGRRWDLALKGSGRTPFSRGGDGRAWLGPVLREYLMSEALHALGVPSTRSLAAARTGQDILRQEGPVPGAVLMRVAQSHIRIGTFQYFAARGDYEALTLLCDHVIARHYPDAGTLADLLDQMVRRQAELVAKWMAVGFIHGVMNTDNCTLSGETIDYGPCAFMEQMDPNRVFSSIDMRGRYAYSNQPAAAQWNLAQFASALVPLEPDEASAISEFTEVIYRFDGYYQAALQEAYRRKLGLSAPAPNLVAELLAHFAAEKIDFTNGFAGIETGTPLPEGWRARWDALRAPGVDLAECTPQVIPRLHLIERAIAAMMDGDPRVFETLLAAVQAPFQRPEDPELTAPAPPDERVERTFCGT